VRQRLAKKQERFKQLQLEEERARRDVAQQRQAREEAAEAAEAACEKLQTEGEGEREKLQLGRAADRDFSVPEQLLDESLDFKADGWVDEEWTGPVALGTRVVDGRGARRVRLRGQGKCLWGCWGTMCQPCFGIPLAVGRQLHSLTHTAGLAVLWRFPADRSGLGLVGPRSHCSWLRAPLNVNVREMRSFEQMRARLQQTMSQGTSEELNMRMDLPELPKFDL
jgi:hypothetical protein